MACSKRQDVEALHTQEVEIPQLGLVRSLNVHTAASVCIWEYTKQQMFGYRP